ncbi:MAG: proline dehydrogenase family protein, partial [Candidatus Binatia bacterium]
MTPGTNLIEPEVQELARSLYHQAAEHKPSIFEPQDWLGKMIEWSLEDESLRVALFRFVDVLPSLDSSAEIGRHLEEYFAKVDHAFGGLVFLAQALHAGWLLAPVARQNVTRLARRFIVDEEPDVLSAALEALRREPAAFTLDVVGEATVSEREAIATERRYLDLLRSLSTVSTGWPLVPQIDQGVAGPLPRVNLSVKISSLCARFDPVDPNSEISVRERLRSLFREAARTGAALTVDMEQYSFKDLTLAIFRNLLEESEFQNEPHATIAIQAYLREAERDVKELINWARTRKRRIGIRLVKGAYWDSELTWAKQKGWPIPVFLDKAETDANYEGLTRLLLESHDVIDAAFGSHNIRSLANAIVTAKKLGVSNSGYEMQMLYGMGEPIRRAVIQCGQRVRVYLPVGRLLPGMAYLIRRLMENTSNTSFLRQTYADEQQIDGLVLPPVPKNAPTQKRSVTRQELQPEKPGPFQNQPLLDFSRRENRTRFAEALAAVRRKFGDDYPLWIGGEEVRTQQWLDSPNPAAPEEIVGRVAVAGRGEAERALLQATEYFSEWSKTPADERAG